MTLPYSKVVFYANDACFLWKDYRQAWRSSSSLGTTREALRGGEGSRTMSVGCMGGWIHTSLQGSFADGLNNCCGWDGGIGWVATSYMERSSNAIVLPSAVGEVPISWSSSLGTYSWSSIYCPPYNM